MKKTTQLEEGNVTIVVMVFIAIVCSLMYGLSTFVFIFVNKQKAQTAADAGALAAIVESTTKDVAEPEVCLAASESVKANGGLLTDCNLTSGIFEVGAKVGNQKAKAAMIQK